MFGAGQYFTPRPLIDSIIRCIKPQAGEVIQDPAAGTAGFLIGADAYIKDNSDDYYTLSEKDRTFQRNKAFVGMELVPGTRRLALMNCLLHGMRGAFGQYAWLTRHATAQSRFDTDQSAIRHSQRRRSPDPRFHPFHQQQTTGLPCNTSTAV